MNVTTATVPKLASSENNQQRRKFGSNRARAFPVRTTRQESRAHQDTATVRQRSHQKLLQLTDTGASEAMVLSWHWVASCDLPHKGQRSSPAVTCGLHCFRGSEAASVIIGFM